MYCIKYGCLYWGHVQMFCRLGIICIAERLTLIQDGNFVANTWSQRTSSVGNVLLHKMYGQQRGKLQKCSNDAQDIFMLFRWLMDKLSQQELERWAVMAWEIWNARNKYLFWSYPNSSQVHSWWSTWIPAGVSTLDSYSNKKLNVFWYCNAYTEWHVFVLHYMLYGHGLVYLHIYWF